MQFAMAEPPVIGSFALRLRARIAAPARAPQCARRCSLMHPLRGVPAKAARHGLRALLTLAARASSFLAKSNIILRRFSTAIAVSQRENKRYVCHRDRSLTISG